ncbi:hypothetical protein J1C67_08270 [Clostridium gasigenes]|uniref:hypothetical protein n=1 Tax=Clostridium gasigenes TaxID=94869 RepID=UPI0014386101|nr:hypothetical protein [Clostridium gasigenes]NKF06564.1 hypothetical protein [Clostridium gasigenes]QSW21081.1 hypothetical protein J1C67_08270 [Clostridium gasigenes]
MYIERKTSRFAEPPVVLPSPLDYVIKPNKPSMKKNPDTMENLQELVKLIS